MIEKVLGTLGGIALSTLILTSIFPLAFARTRINSPYELWNHLEEFERITSLKDELLKRDWVDERVDLEELDYILVLTQQLSEQCFENVTPALALAVISIESAFRGECQSPKGAEGLMQVVPRYHRERIEKYIYEENVDLYDTRLNVMVGMDYLNDILTETEGDLVWALMYYNGGPAYARRNYIEKGRVSSYASTVIQRMEVIEDILNKGMI